MKKLLFIILLTTLSVTKINAQSSWNYLFSRDGVDVYGHWSCDNCYDRHYSFKITNNNSYRVKWSYEKFIWEDSYANPMKSESGGSWWLPAGSTQTAESSGLWFYPPENFKNQNLSCRFVNFKVIKD
jgi:hypothetical protein